MKQYATRGRLNVYVCHRRLHTEILKEYRRLDDTIIMRLNRANAAARDSVRTEDARGNIQDQACLQVWRELVGVFIIFVPTWSNSSASLPQTTAIQIRA